MSTRRATTVVTCSCFENRSREEYTASSWFEQKLARFLRKIERRSFQTVPCFFVRPASFFLHDLANFVIGLIQIGKDALAID